MIAVRTPTSQMTDGNDFRARIATRTTPTTAATAEASTGVAAPDVMLATMIAITMSDGTAPAPDSSQPLTLPLLVMACRFLTRCFFRHQRTTTPRSWPTSAACWRRRAMHSAQANSAVIGQHDHRNSGIHLLMMA